MNKRRELIAALGASALVAPLGSFAQPQRKIWRVGFLSSESNARFGNGNRVAAFRAGLRNLGYEEGKNLVIEFRWADGDYDRLPELAAELVQLKVDVIVTHATLPLRAAMKATTTIPIVTANSGDLVAQGIVTNLARPGGNITGEIFFVIELAAKRIKLLKDALPRLTQAAVLLYADPTGTAALYVQAMEATARALNLTLHIFPVSRPRDFEAAFAAMVMQRLGAVAIADHPVFISNPEVLAELTSRHNLPSIGPNDFALAGGLMAYGVDFPAMWYHASTFVDKIFKGTKPGDIPIEQATRFEMILNMKTAKALGIQFPQAILVQATKVIE
jgi:putative tryptophan/tyrosine transport system substrate-binding protein